MADPTEAKKTKDRSPNFPFIPLEVALERARQIYAAEKRSAVPVPILAKHWRYSPASSGALQTVAALKSYGLMSEEGSGATRKLKLTELALRILLDQRPDSVERERFKRQAAETPAIAQEVYQKWPDALPSEATLNHFLVLERSFAPPYAAKVAKILVENQIFGGQNAADTISPAAETFGEGDTMETGQAVAPERKDAIRVVAKALARRAEAVRTEQLIDPNGVDIILQFAGEPTLESYEFVRDYIELRMKGLKRAATTASSQPHSEKEGD